MEQQFLQPGKRTYDLAGLRFGGLLKRSIPFELTRDQLLGLIYRACYYCGSAKSNRFNSETSDLYIEYNGVDRVDNSKGYVGGNVVTCCKQCNRAKDVMSKEDFVGLCVRVAALHGGVKEHVTAAE